VVGLLLLLGLAVGLGVAVFGLAVLGLRLPEARQLWGMIRARVRPVGGAPPAD
jgi:hypothetical protein